MNHCKKIAVIFVLLPFLFINNVKASCSYESALQTYGPYATDSMKQTGVYASLTLAQGIVEQSLKTSNSNNMFGIKVTGIKTLPLTTDQNTLNQEGAKCRTKGGTWVQTSEYSKTLGTYKAMACFKTYTSPNESFADHGRWLLNDFANRNAFKSATDLEGQLKSLVSNPNARYATSQNYLCSLINIINTCDLTRFDELAGGKHISNLSSEGCSSVIPDTSYSNSENEHFETSYDGDIKQGWIYQRFEFKEVYEKNIPEYKIESNINDVIDEIFNRAKTSFVSYSAGGLVFGTTGETPSNSLDLRNRYWYNYDIDKYIGNTLFGQCVWYAKHRALEIIDSAGYDNETKQKLLASIEKTSGNGQDWYSNPDSSFFNKSNNINDAKPGAIVSWSKGQYGHVAIVENVYEKEGTTYVTISEGWRNGRTESGWTISHSTEDAWAHSTVRKVDLTLEQLKNKDGSFNGYVYLLDN